MSDRPTPEIQAELEMWRDGNILHENHRNELEKAERERDEAKAGREAYKQLAVKHAQERDEAREEVRLLKGILDVLKKEAQ